jgi:branched-chain amino acid transport system substrate-binding protein
MWFKNMKVSRKLSLGFAFILLSVLLIGIVTYVLLTSCGHADSIEIGFTASLSGANSDLGVSSRNGAKLAVDEINEAGGINGRLINLIIKDDKNDKKTALEVDQEFYKEDIKIIIGHMTSDMAELTVPYVNEKKILMLSPTISAEYLSDIDDYFLRMIPSNKEQARKISEDMIENNIHRAAVLYDGSNLLFTESLKNQFITDYVALGGQVVFDEKFIVESIDPYVLLKNIRDSGAEAVFVISGADNVSFLSQNFYKNNFNLDFYLPSWAMTSDLLEHGGKSIEGAHLVNFFNTNTNDQKYLDFVDKYIQIFGSQPSFSSIFSYEAVMVLADAMMKTNSTEPDQLIDYILAKKNFEGLQNSISFTADGDVIRDHYSYTVKDGEFIMTEEG